MIQLFFLYCHVQDMGKLSLYNKVMNGIMLQVYQKDLQEKKSIKAKR